jgi:hypothetical protein
VINRFTLASIATIILLCLAAVGGWWFLHRSPGPELISLRSASIPQTEASVQSPTQASPSEESTSPASITTSPTEPATAFDERGLTEWVVKQKWFTALSESMPKGVRVNFHVSESDEPGWDIVELREFHSFDSGYDPDVSPMIGIFRVSKDRLTTQAMDPVTADWISPDAFMSGRSLGPDEKAGDPRPISPALAAAGGTSGKVITPGKASPERQAICDAVREHIQTFHSKQKLPAFLFVVEHLKTKGKAAAFQGYPVKPDGSPMGTALGDTVFNCLLTEEEGKWLVVVDLTRSDVPSAEEVTSLRNGVPRGFPPDVLTDFWRNLLFP